VGHKQLMCPLHFAVTLAIVNRLWAQLVELAVL